MFSYHAYYTVLFHKLSISGNRAVPDLCGPRFVSKISSSSKQHILVPK